MVKGIALDCAWLCIMQSDTECKKAWMYWPSHCMWAFSLSFKSILSVLTFYLLYATDTASSYSKCIYSNIALEYVWWAILLWSQCVLELCRVNFHLDLESWESMYCASNKKITVSVLFSHHISVLHSCPLTMVWINLFPKGKPVAHSTFYLNKEMFADLRGTPCMDTLVHSVWSI